MPKYEYKCSQCSTEESERVYDILVTLDEIEDMIYCPECKGLLERVNFYHVAGYVH